MHGLLLCKEPLAHLPPPLRWLAIFAPNKQCTIDPGCVGDSVLRCTHFTCSRKKYPLGIFSLIPDPYGILNNQKLTQWTISMFDERIGELMISERAIPTGMRFFNTLRAKFSNDIGCCNDYERFHLKMSLTPSLLCAYKHSRREADQGKMQEQRIGKIKSIG